MFLELMKMATFVYENKVDSSNDTELTGKPKQLDESC